MSGVSSVGQLVAVIQSQFATKLRPAAAKRGSRRAATAGGQSLAQLIELRVAQIDLEDPNRGRKAFRVFLEAVLLQELGGDLNADPAFHQLVDDVQRALEADVRCQPLIQDAITNLLGGNSTRQTTGKT